MRNKVRHPIRQKIMTSLLFLITVVVGLITLTMARFFHEDKRAYLNDWVSISVLSMAEAPEHPQSKARGSFVEIAGQLQPGPAPRLSRTPGQIQRPPAHAGQHTDEALRDWGFGDDELRRLREAKAIA